jgi:hypothetical protein
MKDERLRWAFGQVTRRIMKQQIGRFKSYNDPGWLVSSAYLMIKFWQRLDGRCDHVSVKCLSSVDLNF